jgi:N-acetylglucosamine kinase-like BadF-type ATPase
VAKSQIPNPKFQIFLGVDGGQSHTEAIAADEAGRILGRGFGGASNHAEQPGGRERLRNAILESVGAALKKANLPPLGRLRRKRRGRDGANRRSRLFIQRRGRRFLARRADDQAGDQGTGRFDSARGFGKISA